MTNRRHLLTSTLSLCLLLVSTGTEANAANCTAAIGHWEFTQAIQDDNNTVPLINKRDTTLRLYLIKEDSTCTTNGRYTADLAATYLDGSSVFETSHVVRPTNGDSVALTDTVWNPARRASEDNSLEFTFSPNVWPTQGIYPGPIFFSACPKQVNQQSPCTENQWSDSTAWFAPVRTLRVAGYKVLFNGILPQDSLIRPGVGDAMFRSIYPIPISGNADYYYLPATDPINWDARGCSIEFPWGYDENGHRTEYNPCHLKLTKEIRRRAFLTSSTQLPGGGPNYAYGWVGWTEEATFPDYFGFGWQPHKAAFGFAQPGREHKFTFTFAHELGHLFWGWGHPQNLIADYGWDVLGLTRWRSPVRSNKQRDVMNVDRYSDWSTNWINIEKYRDFYWHVPGSKIGSPPDQDPPQERSMMLLSGVVDVDTGAWTADPIWQVDRNQYQTEPVLGGDGEIRVLDGSQGLLYSTRFDPWTQPEGEGGPVAVGFGAEIPAFAEADAVEVYSEGQLKATVTRTLHAPTVAIEQPLPGQQLDSSTVIEWTAADVDGGDLVSAVQYSHDGGGTWVPVGDTDLVTTTMQLPAGYLAAGSGAMIRVLVSDGFNTSSAEVGGLGLGSNHAPQATIVSPVDADTVAYGANVVFSGMASDWEDVIVDDGSLLWSSSRDGVLGSGPRLNISSLTVGDHIITLTATDSGGAWSSAAVALSVWP